MITAFTILFYLFALYAMVWEFTKLLNPVESFINSQKVQDFSKSKTKFDDYEKSTQSFVINELIEWGVCLLGIFTSQWPLFLGIILLSFVGRLYKRIIVLRVVDNAICGAALLFAVINRFHIHIDINALVLAHLGI